MSTETMAALMDKWTNDAEFREALRANPEQAVRASGIALTADEITALSSVDWNGSNEELTTRISKRGVFL